MPADGRRSRWMSEPARDMGLLGRFFGRSRHHLGKQLFDWAARLGAVLDARDRRLVNADFLGQLMLAPAAAFSEGFDRFRGNHGAQAMRNAYRLSMPDA